MTNNMLKLQLNTPVSQTRDMTVELTNQVTGEKRAAKPYLDGTVAVPNINAGQWRVQVKHPNLLFDVFDRPIRVLPDRPTIVPINIPQNIFENVPIRDVPDADLGPAQQRLDEAADSAERQAKKMPGQPIYADDWNDLASTLGTTARSTKELATLIAPRGHDHPEIVEKVEELQRNLQKLYDVMGASLAQLQRQIQQLALQSKIDSALDKTEKATPAVRLALQEKAKELVDTWADTPGVYSASKRRVGQELQEQLTTVLAQESEVVRKTSEVQDLDAFTQSMATEKQVITYEEEIQQHQRTGSQSKNGVFLEAFKFRAKA